MPFDSETAALAGKKSGEVRRRKKKPDEQARNALLSGAADAASALVEVVRGEAGFEEAKPELRFKAALVVLEYVLGKPRGFDEAPDNEADVSGPAPSVDVNPFQFLIGDSGGESSGEDS